MQIRLTVLGPRSGRAARTCDVLITAPAGTALSAVSGALASGAGSGQPARSSGSSVALYWGAERLDPGALLGMPPLVDGAVLSLHTPAEQHADPRGGTSAPARLCVIGGPDSGGVHLLQGGQVRIGRSAEADVPLDDPDVSRLHCDVTVAADGRVTVADLGSTNGTTVDDRPVGDRPVPLSPGALLRIGESTLYLEPGRGGIPVPAAPDSEGHLRVTLPPSVRPDGGHGSATYPGDRWGPGGPGAPPLPLIPPSTEPPRAEAPRAEAPRTEPSHAEAPRTEPPSTEPPGTGPSRRQDTPQSGSHGYADQEVTYGRGERLRPEDGAPPPRQGQPGGGRVAGTIGAWARRLAAGRTGSGTAGQGADGARLAAEAAALRERWPDPATVLLTALGPGQRLWERGPGHPDALTLRLGTADLPSEDGTGTLRAVPFTVDLRDPHTFALGLAGPRPRLAGLARAVLAQACALHSPTTLELVLISADRSRGAEQRSDEWAWLNWLPQLRPAHGQDCRLLLAFDREQAGARVTELARRLEDGPLGSGWAGAAPEAVAEAAARREGPYTLVVVDGDPGSAALRDTLGRIAAAGPSVGMHVVCLAESPERLATECGAVARLSGDVATTLRMDPHGPAQVVVDAVSPAWAERFARALAPLRETDTAAPRTRNALPRTVRLLDALDLALATPAKITARWDGTPDPAQTEAEGGEDAGQQGLTGYARAGGRALAVLGSGSGGRVVVDLAAEGPHLMVGGAPGSGKTELLRSVASALAAAERPDRLALVLVDGAGTERGEGLRAVTDLPHVSTYLAASDPTRMRAFAQALGAELKRREELLGGQAFGEWHADRMVTVPRQSTARGDGRKPSEQGALRVQTRNDSALPRLVVVVDDFDALVAPGLGSTGRPAAGSVVRALEAVARDGERLGVHLVASTGRPERTSGTEADERSRLRIALRTEDPASATLLVHVEDPAGLDEELPGRGYLRRPGGAVAPFQAGRVSGRIPRTATLRPTVVPLEWERMGDPPTRRPLRELGNGPTDLALLASALQRAAESTGAGAAVPLL
ncbi:FtsK/SpoIIIE domain-containing protein [Streptomyces sp. H10-C2]|uniref:FtsK/SpoIIIE domain-containing protein n=1 Tax=unclassified Streptomyces TaxID=2593676 RepID=UPI0024B9C0F8|nr:MULTISPECIES: FtsK/SpoIIIE domain-containing protein [unclassified Streptomyces]MDJ0345714.1 FtsK/SpoIIIE domain-containing protein [Streptomyces sp. PH10-H1]MDJ0374593.1 FtsK/SpoIIIE domain-containing protein [Streptomyces sp. H10-C2]